jgi:hypothetical protein
MVTPGNLDKAIDFIFGGVEDEYAGLISKVRDYYDNVQSSHNDTVFEMMDKGVRYNIFAKYNFPEYPIYKGSAIQSDGDTPIPRQTFGATAANYGDVLSDKYIASISQENLKYLSPDNKIDASTGLLPENTWYVKNLHHNYWEAIHSTCLAIMNNDYNVSNQDVYPQFMDNNNNMAQVDRMEKLMLDYMHALEFGNTTYHERAHIATAMQQCRHQRRPYKNEAQRLAQLASYLRRKEGCSLMSVLRHVHDLAQHAEQPATKQKYHPRVMEQQEYMKALGKSNQSARGVAEE